MREGVRAVDANLLVALDALLTDRNLTRAGERLMMSQPAMSGALGRLRTHFDDELLHRTPTGFELTPLATRLAPIVREAVESAEALLGASRPFEPASSTRVFSVSLSEYAMTVIGEPLVRAIRTQAPNASVELDVTPSASELEHYLLRRDLIIGPDGFDIPGKSSPLFTDQLVCVVARDNPRVKDGRLTLEDLAEMHHVVAEFSAAGLISRPLEVVAQQEGLADRYVRVRVTSLLAVPVAVSGTDLVGFVPSRLARRCADDLGLTIAQTPLTAVRITESAHWHPRRETEPAGQWLRQLLYDVAVDLEDELDSVEVARR